MKISVNLKKSCNKKVLRSLINNLSVKIEQTEGSEKLNFIKTQMKYYSQLYN